MDDENISQLLLNLYRELPEQATADYIDGAFGLLKQAIGFDSGWIAHGTFDANIGIRIHGLNLFHQPPEKLAEYGAISHLDVTAQRAMNHSGRAVTHRLDEVYPRVSKYEPIRKHALQYGLQHTLNIALPMSGDHLVGVSLSRTHKRHEFEAHQVRAATLLLPHFAQARRQKLALHHQSSGQIHPAEGARAMASQDGCLMFSSGAVVALLQTEWPQWEPPVLPRELMLTLAHTSPPSYVGREIHITAMPFGRALNVCVQQRRKVPVLSAAQLNVARLTTRGLTHKEVARELNLSAHTVRNHLAAIYQKLAVRNKTELAAKWRP